MVYCDLGTASTTFASFRLALVSTVGNQKRRIGSLQGRVVLVSKRWNAYFDMSKDQRQYGHLSFEYSAERKFVDIPPMRAFLFDV